MTFDLAGGVGGGATIAAAFTKTAAWTLANSATTGLITAVGAAPSINAITFDPADPYAAVTLPNATTMAEGESIWIKLGGKNRGLRIVNGDNGMLIGEVKYGTVCLTLMDNENARGSWLAEGKGWFIGPSLMSAPNKSGAAFYTAYAAGLQDTLQPYNGYLNGSQMAVIASPTQLVIIEHETTKICRACVVPITLTGLDFSSAGAWTDIRNTTGTSDGTASSDSVMSASSHGLVALSSTRLFAYAHNTTDSEIEIQPFTISGTVVTRGTVASMGNWSTQLRFRRISDTTFAQTYQETQQFCRAGSISALGVATLESAVKITGTGIQTTNASFHNLKGATEGTFLLTCGYATGASGVEALKPTHIITWDDPGWSITESASLTGTSSYAATVPILGDIYEGEMFAGNDGKNTRVWHADDTGFSAGSVVDIFQSTDITQANARYPSNMDSGYHCHDLAMFAYGEPHGSFRPHLIGKPGVGVINSEYEQSAKVHHYPKATDGAVFAVTTGAADSDNLAGSRHGLLIAILMETTGFAAVGMVMHVPACKFGDVT